MNIVLAGGAVTYEPNDDQIGRVSLEFSAFDGEVGTGQLPLPDPAAAVTVAGGRQAKVQDEGVLVTDGFILDQDRVRGPQPASTAREHTFSVMDANAILGGFRVTRSRGSETDVARVLAFAALDGPSWVTTWVLNSSTVTMPAKKYDTDGGWDELISDVVEFTGKTLWLHDTNIGTRCLHYHVLTTGHTCGLVISDVSSAVDGITTYAPQQPNRQRTSVDLINDVKGRDQAGRVARAVDSASVTAHDVDGLQHSALIDFETNNQSDLNVKTNAFLASQKDERDTWTCAIGPLDFAALTKIRVGDLITTTSTVMGLTASPQRIAHMTLSVYAVNGPPAPGLWLATLELGAPVRRRARVKAGPALAKIVQPYLGTPFVPTPCAAAWDSFDDRETFTPEWGDTSADGIPWTVSALNASGPPITAQGRGWVSGGLGILWSTYGQLPCVYVTSGPMISVSDWEVLFRFRIPNPLPEGEAGSRTVGLSIFRAFGANGNVVAWVLPPDEPAITGEIEAGGWYLCRYARQSGGGDQYRWRTWLDGTTEPATWDDTSSSGPVTAFGFALIANAPVGAPVIDPAEAHIDWIIFGSGDPCEAADPSPGQDAAQTYGESDGTTTDYQTRDPYVPGTLEVYADDIREWNITETNPALGTWAFDTVPFATETIRVEYRAA